MFVVMKDTNYAAKPKFIENFWHDWRKFLGSKHVIQNFGISDFSPIFYSNIREKEKMKQMSAEVGYYNKLFLLQKLFRW